MDSRFLDVNRHGVMRVPMVLWTAIAILSRYWLLLLVVAVSVRRNGDAILLLGEGLSWPLMAMELPVLAVAFAGGRRLPEAGRLTRFVWRYGRELMASTMLANMAWTLAYLVKSSYWTLWPELLLVSFCLMDAAIVLSTYTTPFLKQLFLEFPSSSEEGASP